MNPERRKKVMSLINQAVVELQAEAKDKTDSGDLLVGRQVLDLQHVAECLAHLHEAKRSI